MPTFTPPISAHWLDKNGLRLDRNPIRPERIANTRPAAAVLSGSVRTQAAHIFGIGYERHRDCRQSTRSGRPRSRRQGPS